MSPTPTELSPALAVWVDPERLGGKPCFAGTRCSVDALLNNKPVSDIANRIHHQAVPTKSRESRLGVTNDLNRTQQQPQYESNDRHGRKSESNVTPIDRRVPNSEAGHDDEDPRDGAQCGKQKANETNRRDL